MKLELLAVYDSKAKAFMAPFVVSQIAVAARVFAEAANKMNHQICEHPEDFTLWHLGTFDDDTATFDIKPVYINLGMASQYKTETLTHVQPKVA